MLTRPGRPASKSCCTACNNGAKASLLTYLRGTTSTSGLVSALSRSMSSMIRNTSFTSRLLPRRIMASSSGNTSIFRSSPSSRNRSLASRRSSSLAAGGGACVPGAATGACATSRLAAPPFTGGLPRPYTSTTSRTFRALALRSAKARTAPTCACRERSSTVTSRATSDTSSSGPEHHRPPPAASTRSATARPSLVDTRNSPGRAGDRRSRGPNSRTSAGSASVADHDTASRCARLPCALPAGVPGGATCCTGRTGVGDGAGESCAAGAAAGRSNSLIIARAACTSCWLPRRNN